MATNPRTDFQKVLDPFLARLTSDEKEDFQFTSLNDVQVAVMKIQAEQGQRRSMRNLTRIKGFLEAMEQFGKVVEVFLNASEILCFIWGPMKFLLLTASNFVESFDILLDAYKKVKINPTSCS